jgi:ASC-1-like (ASCH) protein
MCIAESSKIFLSHGLGGDRLRFVQEPRDHIAIMNPKWKLIAKILSGEKRIESRWYKAKFPPWDRIHQGDVIYFKDSGKKVTAKARVSKVLQFGNLNLSLVKDIVEEYGKDIALVNWDYEKWAMGKKYCILLYLEDAQKVEPFAINKSGFGNAVAWMCVGDIERVKV